MATRKTVRPALCNLRSWLTVVAIAALGGCEPPADPGGPGDPLGDDDTVSDDGAMEARVDDNPHSTITCWVRWQTDEPATSRVEFGPTGSLTSYLEDDELVTDHGVIVVGMVPETEYELQAVSVTADGAERRSGYLAWESGALPFGGLNVELRALAPELAQPGWILADLLLERHTDQTLVVMLDMEGRIVWYDDSLAGLEVGGIDATLVNGGTAVLVGGSVPAGERPVELDLSGEVLWEGPEQEEIGADGEMHHMLRKLDNGHYLSMEHVWIDGRMNDRVVEYDAGLDQVWSWDTGVLCDQICSGNPLWGNSMQLGDDGDVLYYNSMLYSALVKVDRVSGDIEWVFGEHYGFDVDSSGQTTEPWPRHFHTPTRLPDGNLLIFDNGGPEREHSRVVEYSVDEDAESAQLIWEYPGSDVEDHWKNDNWGTAARLDNGNTFVVAGNIFPEMTQTRMFEVTPMGEKVWELVFHPDVEDEIAATFSAKRIPAIARPL